MSGKMHILLLPKIRNHIFVTTVAVPFPFASHVSLLRVELLCLCFRNCHRFALNHPRAQRSSSSTGAVVVDPSPPTGHALLLEKFLRTHVPPVMMRDWLLIFSAVWVKCSQTCKPSPKGKSPLSFLSCSRANSDTAYSHTYRLRRTL